MKGPKWLAKLNAQELADEEPRAVHYLAEGGEGKNLQLETFEFQNATLTFLIREDAYGVENAKYSKKRQK